MKNFEISHGITRFGRLFVSAFFLLAAFTISAVSQTPQETPPPPLDPPGLTLPDVQEMTLPNGLKVVVVQRRNVPLVTASVLVRKGASDENSKKAGVASMTADLLTKGTNLKNATEIAEQIEFLGATISTGAGWNASSATVSVTSDKLGRALSIMSETFIRPVFPQKEVDLFKKQMLDGFAVSLKQPGALFSYAAAAYTYGEHPVSGTPESVKTLSRNDLVAYHASNYKPENSVLIFSGDINPQSAFGFAKLFFGGWESGQTKIQEVKAPVDTLREKPPIISRIMVIDLPDSGQAAVGFTNTLLYQRTISPHVYYASRVLNSVLGGGYSARLNQEIRLKRGLSYGARSGFSWRSSGVNFSAVAQTKNESAGEVAELIRIEIEKLINHAVEPPEMTPRKAVVTGGFGRGLQTNDGLVDELSDLYSFGLTADKLNEFMGGIKAVKSDDIQSLGSNLGGGDLIIVGDAKLFIDDLKKRFPDHKVNVIKASQLNLNSRTLRK